MAHYNKGANAERELVRLFWGKGFAIARIAGSGKNALPMPDLIVMGKGRSIVIEAKAWRANNLTILDGQMQELFKWHELANAEVYVAWKYPNKGWFFIRPRDFRKNKHYSISFTEAQRKGATLEILLGEQSRLRDTAESSPSGQKKQAQPSSGR
ncbi:MAG: hypothetical protein HY544_03100 [Candidatus Diapherotrites archaeon]|uniref:Holliday junction resolvase n=1 Tax=Candidatus Iainarchaeum sp. TaxID=3101447 RepID=A0A8T3YKC2_9ARCH|nr:hypothetical protein [Candidatus Diapherotrites archaeon]